MIEVVTHCWSGPDVPIYHKLLRLQINSIITNPPVVPVHVVVFHHMDDDRTKEVLREARDYWSRKLPTMPPITTVPLDGSQLFRRAIGRNMAAKTTRADVVWFTDCDHLFMTGCLDSAYAASRESPTLCWPSRVWINTAHFLGDELISKAEDIPWGKLSVRTKGFYQREEKKAIGGLQIVHGDWCRRNGYLEGTKWMEPVRSDHFCQCKCDVPFRKAAGPGKAVDILALYRVRHSRAGRDKGEKDHGK